MRRKTVSRFLVVLIVVALGATTGCLIKKIPFSAAEHSAVTTAITHAVRGDMNLIAIEKVSLVRTAPYLRIALKILSDKAPKSRGALRTHIHHNAMTVIREVAQGGSTAGISAITVEYYLSAFDTPGPQPKEPERIRLLYSTSVQIEALTKHDVSTITDDQLAALVTHTTDEIRKLDLPN